MILQDVINKFDGYKIRITVDKDNELRTEMNKKLDAYCEKIKELKDLDKNIAYDAMILSKKIQYCFNQYYKGNIFGSSNTMNELLNQYKNDLYIHDMDSANSLNIYTKVNEYLYKGVVADWSKYIDRNYMLHIPFDKRDIIKTQRFSIPGIPCLYLGHSIFSVWEELNRPSFDNLFISRFNLNPGTKVLDLGLSLIDLIELNNLVTGTNWNPSHPLYRSNGGINEILRKYLFTNILKIACLIKVKQENRDFKSEYIIPQLLLMSVVNCFPNLKIAEGIRYSSVKISTDSYIYVNYAFPAIQDDIKDKLSKDLIDKVKLTQPMNLSLYGFTNPPASRNLPENIFRSCAPYEVNNDYITSYASSEFYNIELKINNDKKLKCSKIV